MKNVSMMNLFGIKVIMKLNLLFMSNVSKNQVKVMSLLFLGSLILNAGLHFIDEARYSFDFLFNARQLVGLLGFAAFFSIFPIGVYNFIAETKYKKNAIVISMLGYVPFAIFACLPLLNLR